MQVLCASETRVHNQLVRRIVFCSKSNIPSSYTFGPTCIVLWFFTYTYAHDGSDKCTSGNPILCKCIRFNLVASTFTVEGEMKWWRHVASPNIAVNTVSVSIENNNGDKNRKYSHDEANIAPFVGWMHALRVLTECSRQKRFHLEFSLLPFLSAPKFVEIELRFCFMYLLTIRFKWILHLTDLSSGSELLSLSTWTLTRIHKT